MAATTPQDRKPKAEKTEDYFSFESGGETYTMPNRTVDVINTKWVRLNRRRDETDYSFTALEALAGDDEDVLDAIDNLSRSDLHKVLDKFQKHLGVALGE